ncbi:MAG: outer membrane beta-barrel protein [Spirochaetota bacterium]|nr:outer membrane beta-barrel protein [Spirochaetota bacterium]
MLLLVFIFSMHYRLFSSVDNNPTPKISMGIGISFGDYETTREYGSGGEWESEGAFGCGFIFENMLSNRFGIHSGIWFSQFILSIHETNHGHHDESTEDNYSDDIESRNNMLTIPLYLITSFQFSMITLNLLTGLNFSYITESFLYNNTSNQQRSVDIKKYIGYTQIGIGGGLEIKFRFFRFVDIFLSGIGERYFNDYIPADDNWEGFLYDFRILTGVLFRTHK